MSFHPFLNFWERGLSFCPWGHFFCLYISSYLSLSLPELQESVSLFIFFVFTIFPRSFSIYSFHLTSTYALIPPLLKKNPYPSIHPSPNFSYLIAKLCMPAGSAALPLLHPFSSHTYPPPFRGPKGWTVFLSNPILFSQSTLSFCPCCHPLLEGTLYSLPQWSFPQCPQPVPLLILFTCFSFSLGL